MVVATQKRKKKVAKKKATKRKPAKKKAAAYSESQSAAEPAADVSPETLVEFGPIRDLDCSRMRRHPNNRHPKQSSVETLAESIRDHGQLEPVLVRWMEGEGWEDADYEILSGETRWLAHKFLKRDFIDCRIGKCDDATALKLVAAANGARTDLDPVERAELLQRLVADPPEGSGLTHEAAGKLMSADGVQLSRSAVSNSLRLLKLPDCLLKELRAGVLPESYAREILSYFDNANAARIANQIVLEMLKHIAEYSRADWVRDFEWAFRDETKPMKFGKPQDWQLSNNRYSEHGGAWFKPSKGDAEQLGIVAIGKEKRATNVKLWKHLQDEAAETIKSKKKAKDAKESAGLSDAQRIQKRKYQLESKINDWRTLWKRWWLSNEVDGRDVVLGFLFRMAGHRGVFIEDVIDVLADANGIKLGKSNFGLPLYEEIFNTWNRTDFTQKIAAEILFSKDPDDLVRIDSDDVNDLAEALDFIDSAAWQAIQESGCDRTREMLKNFFNIFTKDELGDLAFTCKVSSQVKGFKKKSDYVDFFSETQINMPPILKE